MRVFLRKHAYIILIAAFAAIVAVSGFLIFRRYRKNVVINEVCTSNVSCCEDANGRFPDWIELYNPSDEDLDISGYTVSRSTKKKKDKFVVPDGTVISSKSFYIFDPGYTIPSEGSGLDLLDERGSFSDHVDIPSLQYDTTFARTDDAAYKWEIKSPTPGYSNSEGEALDPVLDGEVTVSVAPGFYEEGFDLGLSSSNWGRRIYYTTDGSDPRKNGNEYTGPVRIEDRTREENRYSAIPEVSLDYIRGEADLPTFKVDKCTVVRAVAKDWLGRFTQVSDFSYFVGFDKKAAYDGITVISAVADPDDLFSYENGIMVLGKDYDEYVAAGRPEDYEGSNANFTRRGRKSERAANLEIFDVNRNLSADVKAGIRIKGLSSRWDPQKSLNIVFRRAYSGSDRCDFTADGRSFNRHSLCLDKCGQDTATKMTDIIMERCMKDSGCATNDGVPAVLFINGEYWGLYWLMDRIDESYIADEYGVDKEDVQIIESEDFGDAGIEWVDDNFDMDALFEYYASNIIVAHDRDWPAFNVRFWRTLSDEGTQYGDTRLRPVIFDMNSESMLTPGYDVIEYLMEWYPFMSASDDPLFREKISAKIDEMSANEFAPEKVESMIDGLYDKMRPQMILDRMRFTNCSESEAARSYYESVQIIRDFYQNRWEPLAKYKEQYLNGK